MKKQKNKIRKDNFKKGEVVIYKTSKNEVELKVYFEDETVWLTQQQIALLFGTQRPAITKHLYNIFKTGELNKSSVSSILEHTAADGKTYKTQFYSLDAILSVGYRVNSVRATQFRIWATKTLKEYLIKGYNVNERRLLEMRERFKELQETIEFLRKKSKRERLKGQEGEILDLLASYAKTFSTLEAYDKGALADVTGKKTSFVLKYEDCQKIIQKIKKELVFKNEAGDLFGRERDGSFAGVVRGLYQTFAQRELYQSIEDKASHLLYFVIKDHPFSDGNKRIGSFLFVYFLDRTGHLFKETDERKINDNALTALALLIAESDPKEKEVMIRLIKHLIAE